MERTTIDGGPWAPSLKGTHPGADGGGVPRSTSPTRRPIGRTATAGVAR
ncbi:hypothetical protein KSP35_13945 [Aquihabitans sp. G128]|nr:hypothetical protein [Aquihabitans sp. G128]QXC59495.1 hypothetical protein KSP35_13945 [Aquihabitans sp. G128]